MSHSIINLTAKVVNQEIDNILADYSQYSVNFLSLPAIRQEIITNVLERIPHRYVLVENQPEITKVDNVYHGPLEERLQIEYLIRDIIFNIVSLASEQLLENKICE